MRTLAAVALLMLAPFDAARSDDHSQLDDSARASFFEPSIAPDGSQIAFVHAGDVWVAPASGGRAQRMMTTLAVESRPLYSPDGARLAFVSTRTGDGDVYVLTIATGALVRLTFADGLDQLDAWSRDGAWIYFTTWIRDLGAGKQDIFRVRADGGTPMPVSADRFANEQFAAPSPDGTTIAFAGRGSGDWVRRGHSHRDESEIWLRTEGSPATYRRLTRGDGAKEQWPMWSADGRLLYYVSDRDGAENVWLHRPSGADSPITRFREGRVLWPSISADGRTIVFERDFGVWRLDVATGAARPIAIALPSAPQAPTIQHLKLEDQIRELALSPDGTRVAFVVHDEVFVAPARESGGARRVSASPGSETQVTWSPDGRRVAYRAERRGVVMIMAYDLGEGREIALTDGRGNDHSPRFSPSGGVVAFVRNGRELRVVDVATKRERLVAAGSFGNGVELPFRYEQLLAWSPDGRWLVFVPRGGAYARNPHVVAASGGTPRPVSVLHNFSASTVSWSADGRVILFDVRTSGETRRVARVDLRPTGDGISFERLRERTSFLTAPGDVAYQTISPDGKWALLNGSAGGQAHLWLVSLDDAQPAAARQLTSTGAPRSYAQVSPDGSEVFFLEQGRIRALTVETRTQRTLPVVAELDVDFAQEKLEVFHQAWRYVNDVFPDSSLNHLDWSAVRARYAPQIAGAATPEELRRLIGLMFGELNASHFAIGMGGGSGPRTAGLGLDFDRGEYERSGRLRIRDVVPLGPADLAGGITKGDYVLAVDGTLLSARTNLDSLLDQKIGRRVVLSVAESPAAVRARGVAVRPGSLVGEQALRYRAWVEAKRQLVERASGGRLGYVHLRNMTADAMARLHLDLDEENRAREGIVVDVRNNFGGVTSSELLDLLTRREFLTGRQRAMPDVSGRVLYGQAALARPTVLVTNRQTISDGENFTEGYRALRLGRVVGEPTAGFVLEYGLARLIDGSIMMLPETMQLGSDGVALEMHPRPVDVFVAQPMGEAESGEDVQLTAAVRELLRTLAQARPGAR